MTPRVLVTGAAGFVGRAVVDRLVADGVAVTAAMRRPVPVPAGVRVVTVADIGPDTDWTTALEDATAVVHCAARVHVMREVASDPAAAFRAVNALGTRALAAQAIMRGARRFVYLSSVKVHGEHTLPGRPFRASDRPRPSDPYGVSKLQAEQTLQELAAEGALDLAIIRPPLVYGPGVKANFRSLARLVATGVPLPFGAITGNRRSYVALDNLVDLIVCCLRRGEAIGEVFLVSDGEDLSTADLLRRTAAALGVAARLVPVPVAALAAGARLLGRPDLWQRLAGTLQVDTQPTRDRLEWTPPVSVDDALRRALAGLRR